jgi:hypothetical protein
MHEAEILLGEDAATAPEFMRELEDSLKQTPKYPQQLPLLETPEEDEGLDLREKQPRHRLPRQLPSAPPPQQLRIEVWRESKGGQRRVRVTQL